jgi:hypothetical protein
MEWKMNSTSGLDVAAATSERSFYSGTGKQPRRIAPFLIARFLAAAVYVAASPLAG